MPTMAADLGRVEAELASSVVSADPYLTEIASHLIAAGGKRVRPGFCIAAAATNAEDRSFDAGAAGAHIDIVRAAVSVELVHLGSLYHDDVMDDAITRRNVESVNAKWGNLKAILAGDFLLARASEIASSLGVEVAGLLASTIARLCEGQVLELRYTYDVDRTEADYFSSIDGKTAALLATACRIGGIVAELPQSQTDALTTFGSAYGMAFQIVDDVLDLVATAEELGKPSGHDMLEGVYTLPVLRTLQSDVGDELRPLLTDHMTDEDLAKAVALVKGAGWIQGAIDEARKFADTAVAAIGSLPESMGVQGLSAAAAHLVDSVEALAAR